MLGQQASRVESSGVEDQHPDKATSGEGVEHGWTSKVRELVIRETEELEIWETEKLEIWETEELEIWETEELWIWGA